MLKISKKILKIFRNKLKNIQFRHTKLYLYVSSTDIYNDKKVHYEIIDDIKYLDTVIIERGSCFFLRYKKWLQKDYKCVGISHKKQIIGVIWIVLTGDVYFYNNYRYKIESGEAVLIDVYVLKKYRGRGIFKKLWISAFQFLKIKGINKIHGPVYSHFIHSIKAHYKIGIYLIDKEIDIYRIGFFTKTSETSYKDPVKVEELVKNIDFKSDTHLPIIN